MYNSAKGNWWDLILKYYNKYTLIYITNNSNKIVIFYCSSWKLFEATTLGTVGWRRAVRSLGIEGVRTHSWNWRRWYNCVTGTVNRYRWASFTDRQDQRTICFGFLNIQFSTNISILIFSQRTDRFISFSSWFRILSRHLLMAFGSTGRSRSSFFEENGFRQPPKQSHNRQCRSIWNNLFYSFEISTWNYKNFERISIRRWFECEKLGFKYLYIFYIFFLPIIHACSVVYYTYALKFYYFDRDKIKEFSNCRVRVYVLATLGEE